MQMPYRNAKVYTDGSHYIAIPYRPKPTKKRKTPEDTKDISEEISLKQRFEESYAESKTLNKDEREQFIVDSIEPYVEDSQTAKQFVEDNIQRKKINGVVRKVRLKRKLYLQEWNYFCTFTYDDKLHTEETFRKKLTNCLRHLSHRKSWKYIGVWERSPEQNRLHFHGIFYIPENAMIGELVATNDYNTKSHKMQLIYSNAHFKCRFGRNDFKPIYTNDDISHAINYIMKYMEKTGEKIIYSRGLPTYFVSDILDNDVLCYYGIEDRKLLLADDFTCIKDGEIIGTVSRESIEQMDKSN